MKTEPAYKPQDWVLYELEDGRAGYGKIVGAITIDSDWHYLLEGPSVNRDRVQVPQPSIKFIYENANWTAPTNFMGSNSAYAAAEAPGA